jgi:hypothetical protein
MLIDLIEKSRYDYEFEIDDEYVVEQSLEQAQYQYYNMRNNNKEKYQRQ